jgi:metal transporter CNNM
MAVVIPTPTKAPLTSITVSSANLDMPICLKTPRWTATDRTNARIVSRMKAVAGQVDWTTDFLDAARTTSNIHMHHKHSILGIRSPKPVGIVTFEDLIDTILQKTSRDERDFFDRDTNSPPTKAKKIGDYPTESTTHCALQTNSNFPTYAQKAKASFQSSMQRGTLRRRNFSNNERPRGAMDGADEHSMNAEDGYDIKTKKLRSNYGESSYTLNSRGGFHGSNKSGISLESATVLSAEELTELANYTTPSVQHASPLKAVSLPSRMGEIAILPDGLNPLWRHASAAPRLPHLRRVTPFSRQNSSSYEQLPDEETMKPGLVLPVVSMSPAQNLPNGYGTQFDANTSGIDINDSMADSILEDARDCNREGSGDTISLSSWYGQLDKNEEETTDLSNAFLLKSASEDHKNHHPARGGLATAVEEVCTKPYDGFPKELLDLGKNKENHVPDYASKTLPRMIGLMADLDAFCERRNCETPIRETSFHDDRALLPSQRRMLNGSPNVGGARSSSLWF